jgi:hypothetical protein
MYRNNRAFPGKPETAGQAPAHHQRPNQSGTGGIGNGIRPLDAGVVEDSLDER